MAAGVIPVIMDGPEDDSNQPLWKENYSILAAPSIVFKETRTPFVLCESSPMHW